MVMLKIQNNSSVWQFWKHKKSKPHNHNRISFLFSFILILSWPLDLLFSSLVFVFRLVFSRHSSPLLSLSLSFSVFFLCLCLVTVSVCCNVLLLLWCVLLLLLLCVAVCCVVWTHWKNPRVLDSKRPRVYRHHAHMLKHMSAWCQYTRRRFERSHGRCLGWTHWDEEWGCHRQFWQSKFAPRRVITCFTSSPKVTHWISPT